MWCNEIHQTGSRVSRKPSVAELLELDIDSRIGVECWRETWATVGLEDETVAALLRYAYGQGYTDALTEPHLGQLCDDHGLRVPKRRARSDQ